MGDGAEGALAVEEGLEGVGVGVLDEADDDHVIAGRDELLRAADVHPARACPPRCAVIAVFHGDVRRARGRPLGRERAGATAGGFFFFFFIVAWCFLQDGGRSLERRLLGGYRESGAMALPSRRTARRTARGRGHRDRVHGIGPRESVARKTVASTRPRSRLAPRGSWPAPGASMSPAYVRGRRSARVADLPVDADHSAIARWVAAHVVMRHGRARRSNGPFHIGG